MGQAELSFGATGQKQAARPEHQQSNKSSGGFNNKAVKGGQCHKLEPLSSNEVLPPGPMTFNANALRLHPSYLKHQPRFKRP